MLKIKVESIIAPNQFIRKHRYELTTESLESFELGKRYSDFSMIEPFIIEYNTDLTTLETGDIIVKDWQYGHLKNTGYKAWEVIEPFDGMNVSVGKDGEVLYRICADPTISKDDTWHKLDKRELIK